MFEFILFREAWYWKTKTRHLINGRQLHAYRYCMVLSHDHYSKFSGHSVLNSEIEAKKKKPSVLNRIFKKLTDQTNSMNNNIPSCSLNEPLSKDLLQVGLLLQVKHRL